MNNFLKKTVVVFILCGVAFTYGAFTAQPTHRANANWLANFEVFAANFMKMLIDAIQEIVAKVIINRALTTIQEKVNEHMQEVGAVVGNFGEYFEDAVGIAGMDTLQWYMDNCFSTDPEMINLVMEFEFGDDGRYSEVEECPPTSNAESRYVSNGFTIDEDDVDFWSEELTGSTTNQMEDYLIASIMDDWNTYSMLEDRVDRAMAKKEHEILVETLANEGGTEEQAVRDKYGNLQLSAGKFSNYQEQLDWAQARALSDSKQIIAAIITPILQTAVDKFLEESDSTLGTDFSEYGQYSDSNAPYDTDFVNRWYRNKDDDPEN